MSGSIGHCGRPGCNCPTDDEIDRIAAATAHIPRLNRAMLALDAEDHFSDRHDPEALMGEYELPEVVRDWVAGTPTPAAVLREALDHGPWDDADD